MLIIFSQKLYLDIISASIFGFAIADAPSELASFNKRKCLQFADSPN